MRQVEYEVVGMETHQKTLGPEHPEDQTTAMMMMKVTRMMTEGEAGRIKLLPIKEDGTRDPQTMREQKKKTGFPAY